MGGIVAFLIWLSAIPLHARTGVAVPLLAPSLPTKGVIKEKASRSQLRAVGFEIGAIGIRNSSSNDFLGLQLLFGLRANLIYPLSNRVFLKPSVGYFLKPEGDGQVSVTQNVIEAGLGIQYALLMKKSFLWHAGISQRVDYLFSKISIKDASNTTPGTFRYRAGGSTGLRFRINSKSDFTFDLEAGVTPFDSFRFQAGVSSGIIFFID